MKKLIIILAMVILPSLFSITKGDQQIYPQGFLVGWEVVIDKNWQVVIIVKCEPPYTEYCVTMPYERSSVATKQLQISAPLYDAMKNPQNYDVELVSSSTSERVYTLTPKKTKK